MPGDKAVVNNDQQVQGNTVQLSPLLEINSRITKQDESDIGSVEDTSVSKSHFELHP